jgi:hypothetical protein
MAEDDPIEVVELERMTGLRIKKLGESSSDVVNAAAAKPLQRLAERAHVFGRASASASFRPRARTICAC